ncbi:hypothetical protein D3C81_2109830 [compost metagenome]
MQAVGSNRDLFETLVVFLPIVGGNVIDVRNHQVDIPPRERSEANPPIRKGRHLDSKPLFL